MTPDEQRYEEYEADYSAYAAALERAPLEACAMVERGMAFLDEHVPGWEHILKVGSARRKGPLDLGDGRQCVWGQLARYDLESWFGKKGSRVRRGRRLDYGAAVTYLLDHGLVPVANEQERIEVLDVWAAQHGFYLGRKHPLGVTYGLLTETWRQAVLARRAAQLAARAADPDAQS